jgi:predicted glycogen debranching enzyme
MDPMTLPRSDFVDEDGALAREWLVTNGLGGFACGTIALANTRRYHGLLIASLSPPVERTLMVAKLDVTVRYQERTFELACNEYADGTIAPRGYTHLAAFHLEDGIPVWTYALAAARLEQRIWMAQGRNTTYVSFTLRHAPQALELSVLPLCTYRDYHASTQGGASLDVAGEARGCRITATPGARPYRLLLDRGKFLAGAAWYWQFRHRVEAERGLDAVEDLFQPGIFTARLAPNETVTWIATAESETPTAAPAALAEEVSRRKSLVAEVTTTTPSWIRALTLAADQFLVTRATADERGPGKTVIAGYPWFTDWGRDTMIALPGLTLVRQRDAALILRTYATYTSEGMLPNRFPDRGAAPEYGTVDAALWYFYAVNAYVEISGDVELLRDLFAVLREIVEWHRRGTRFGIKVDAADGLLRAGADGVQVTWMDAKVGDRVVTPRIGKPVEINALWHFALASMARWARMLSEQTLAKEFERATVQVARNFARAFWCEARSYLYDVIDGPGGAPDASLRPNQIFAVSLGTKLLDARRARAVVDACGRELLTPVGLRTLAASDPQYAGQYQGGQQERDAAYHQGTVWAWLLGPFTLAHHRVYQDAAYCTSLLAGLAPHLGEGCLGTIGEIFDGDAPHAPRGCFAQAWSVCQTLFAWHTLTRRAAAPGVE